MFYNLVTQDKCKEFVSRLQTNNQWIDGKLTTATGLRDIKTNKELYGTRISEEICNFCMESIFNHMDLRDSTLLKRVISCMLNRYEVGEGYGWHFDSPLLNLPSGELARTDYSFTIFLNDDYEGGELQIEDEFVKGKAGEMYIYNSNLRHCVHPVTKGTRYACFGWIEAVIADKEVRQQLITNNALIQSEKNENVDHDSEIAIALDKTSTLLIRKFY